MGVPVGVLDPSRLILVSYSYALDGGSFELHCRDETGEPHVVRLQQRAFPEYDGRGWVPGRLYYDGMDVPIRSAQEARLLGLLRAAEVQSEPPARDPLPNPLAGADLTFVPDLAALMSAPLDDALRSLVGQLLSFVGSDAYLEFAARVDAHRRNGSAVGGS